MLLTASQGGYFKGGTLAKTSDASTLGRSCLDREPRIVSRKSPYPPKKNTNHEITLTICESARNYPDRSFV